MTTIEGRERARARPIDGPYRDYALEVRRLLGYFGGRSLLSLRAAEGKTEVKHTTIGTMARGFRADSYNTRRFAERLGGDPDQLLRLGGHIAENDDPLFRLGPDVDIAALRSVPHSPLLASAGNESFPGDTALEPSPLGDELPGGVRSLRVQGDCMEPQYQDGDILLVRPTAEAKSGDEVVALEFAEDRLICKIYYSNGTQYLEPLNGEQRIYADAFRILGVVEGYVRLRR